MRGKIMGIRWACFFRRGQEVSMKKTICLLLCAAFALFGAGCSDKGSNPVSISFPAYQEGQNESNAQIYGTAPFIAALSLPDGWETRLPEEQDREGAGPVYTKVDFYRDGRYMGFIGFNTFTPVEGEVPREDYYKTVYPELRLGSLCQWEPYKPVKSDGTGEAAVCTVSYKDPQEIDKHPGALAEVPVVEVPGVLCYDKELKVYVGIQFAEDSLTDEQARQVAMSLELQAAP